MGISVGLKGHSTFASAKPPPSKVDPGLCVFFFQTNNSSYYQYKHVNYIYIQQTQCIKF